MYDNIPVELWINDWINLFPKGVRSGGKLLRSDKRSALKKMKSFIKEYGYSPDEIFKATIDYLAEREREDFAFTRCAVYFIDKKGEGSTLAERIENQSSLDTEEIIEEDYFG